MAICYMRTRDKAARDEYVKDSLARNPGYVARVWMEVGHAQNDLLMYYCCELYKKIKKPAVK